MMTKSELIQKIADELSLSKKDVKAVIESLATVIVEGGAVNATGRFGVSVGTNNLTYSQTGGVVTVRAWDPPHFDPHLTISYKTHIAYSFTHSRLLKHRAGPGVVPGTFPIEGDLAESWKVDEDGKTYTFVLRANAHWHKTQAPAQDPRTVITPKCCWNGIFPVSR
jgi:ABC-type transport system substrate-binding protein